MNYGFISWFVSANNNQWFIVGFFIGLIPLIVYYYISYKTYGLDSLIRPYMLLEQKTLTENDIFEGFHCCPHFLLTKLSSIQFFFFDFDVLAMSSFVFSNCKFSYNNFWKSVNPMEKIEYGGTILNEGRFYFSRFVGHRCTLGHGNQLLRHRAEKIYFTIRSKP